MRTLNENEVCRVAGGTGTCPADGGSGNNIGGLTNTAETGNDFINIYEGAVAAVSHVIERIAKSL